MKKKILLILTIASIGIMNLFGQSQAESMETSEFVLIVTPKGEKVRLRYLERTEVKAIETEPTTKNISNKRLDKEGRPAFLLSNQQVAYRHFIDGHGLLFASERDFSTCYEPSSYLGFGIRPDIEKNDISFYWFELPSPFVKEFILPRKKAELNDFTSSNGTAFVLDDGSVFFGYAPSNNYGNWFPNEGMFRLFWRSIHAKDEPQRDEVISKRIIIDDTGDFVQATRVVEKSIPSNFLRNAQFLSRFKIGDRKAYKLNGGKYAIQDTDVFLIFESEQDFEKSIHSFSSGDVTLSWMQEKERIKSFHESASYCKQQIESLLDLPELHWDFQSLDRVGARLNDYYSSPLFRDLLLLPCLSFTFEVYMKETGKGTWESIERPAKPQGLWEPGFVVEKGSNIIPVFQQVGAELRDQETKYRSCIECIIYGMGILNVEKED